MKTFKLRCVVLEDEDDNRLWMVEKLNEYPELDIIGEATNIDDAYRLIVTTKPDVAFMDVQLIGGDAFTLLSRLQSNGLPIPYIVMATGYPEYVMTALNEYRHYVVQYLTKPFIEDHQTKFRKAIDALMAATTTNDLQSKGDDLKKVDTSTNESTHTFLQHKGSLLRLDFADIAYLEAAGGGESIVVLENNMNHTVDLTLTKFMDLLPDNFSKISRSNIINTNKVHSINRGERTVLIIKEPKNKELGISDNYYNDLLKQLPLAKNKLLNKSTEDKTKVDGAGTTTFKKNQTSKQADKTTLVKEKKGETLISGTTKKQGIVKLNSTQNGSIEKLSHINILSVSLRDSSNKKQKVPTTKFKKEIADCLRHFDILLTNNGIEKYKTTDDSYIGRLVSGEHQPGKPKDIINAALEIQRWINNWKFTNKLDNQSSIEPFIAIHSEVLNVEETNEKKYDSLDNEVISIARSIEKIGQPGEVNISTCTWRLVRKEFSCRFWESMTTEDGKEIEIYTVK